MTSKKDAHLTTLRHYHNVEARMIEAVGQVKSEHVQAFLVATKVALTDTYLHIVEQMIENPTQFEGMSFNNILRSSLKEQLHKGK